MVLQELEGVTGSDKGLQGVKKGNLVLHGVTGGYKGLQGVKRVTWAYKWLKGVTGGAKGLQEVTGATRR